jgi:hypothetical protein
VTALTTGMGKETKITCTCGDVASEILHRLNLGFDVVDHRYRFFITAVHMDDARRSSFVHFFHAVSTWQ